MNTPWRRIVTATAPVCLLLAIGATVIYGRYATRTPAAAENRTLRIGVRSTAEARTVLRSFLFAEGLFALDWQGTPSPRLATSVPEWEDDGLTLRVHLRPDAHFHDGTPVTASTVVKILKQKMAKPQSIGFEAVKSLETGEDGSLVFHLSRPDGFLTSTLATTLIIDDDKPDVGTGPFRLVPEKENLEVGRNTSYYRGTPEIETVQVKTYTTARATWVGLLRNEVDMALEISKESVDFVKDAARFRIVSSIQPFYIPLVFNLRNPILARKDVRRAISDAINRDEIVKHGMRTRGQVADDPIWPFHWAYNNAAPQHKPDPLGARERLDGAGLPVRPATPGRRASRFQLKCLFYNVDPQFERIGLLLQRQLAAVGIDLILEGVNEKQLVTRLGTGDFDSYLFQLTSGRDVSWAYRFWHSPNGALGPVMQNTGYSGADGVLDKLRQAHEESDIRVAVGDLRQRFYEDVPAVFLAWPQITRAVDTKFDIGNPSDPEIFANLWRWHVAPSQTASR